MNSRLTRAFGSLTLVLIAISACKRSSRTVVEPAPVITRPTDARQNSLNKRVYAADGMCSDKLIQHYTSQLRLTRMIMATLHDRLADYKNARGGEIGDARYTPNVKSEGRAAERLKESFAFWRDVYTPFSRRYGTFWCMRRDTNAVLSSAELETGIDVIWATVKHLGPLSPEQNFELKE